MTAIIIMLLGVAAALYGAWQIVVAITSQNTYRKHLIRGELMTKNTARAREERREERKNLIITGAVCLGIGMLVFGFGYYVGYSERGNGLWIYKYIYPEPDAVPAVAHEEYTADSGRTYTYYIIVTGKEYRFCDEECADIEALREKLSSIERENTVMLIDSYAVSAEYHAVEELLKDMAIKYETEEK